MRELFDRVGHIVELLELGRQTPTNPLHAAGSRFSRHRPNFFPSPTHDPVHGSSLSPPDDDADSMHTLPAGHSPGHVSRNTLPAGISFESTLEWPIFQDIIPDRISSLVLQKHLVVDENGHLNRAFDNHMSRDSRSAVSAVSEEQTSMFVLGDETCVPALCQRYLKVVHVKNPIFEASRFNLHVKRVGEHGFDWGESSCVVVRVEQSSRSPY